MRSSKRWLVLGWVAFFLATSGVFHGVQAGTGPQTFNPNQGQEAPYAAGEVLVKFKDSPAAFRGKPAKEHFHSLEGAAAREFAAALPDKAQEALRRVEGRVLRAHPHIGVFKLKLPADLSVSQAIESLHRSGAVEYAEPNVQIRLQGSPNDTLFPSQWGLHNNGSTGTAGADIKAPEAWDIITGGTSTIVAIIDTGVDYLHEDLAANMWVNPGEIPANINDDDFNGYTDDYYGINTSVTPSSGDPMDAQGHGTAMAGIIGAVGNNTKGMAGINWQTRIMALKFANTGTSYIDNAITLMTYARNQKAKRDLAEGKNTPMVMVLGWSQYQKSSYVNSLHDALRNAQDAGIIVVIAAGNDNEDTDILPNYPSSYSHDVRDFPSPSPNSITLDNVISVGASDMYDNKEATSSFGMATVDLFAPGKNITCTMPRDAGGVSKYGSGTGTSYAAAHVAGACALLWNKYPDKDWKQIKGMVLNGAEDGMTQDFRAICVTEGRLNLFNSLNPALVNTPAVFSIFEVNPSPVPTDPTIAPGRADTNDTIVITGVNFGPPETPGSVSFLGTSFPAANIISWDNEKIVATVPANLPKGTGRLLVTNAAGLTSRGACFSNISHEKLVGNLILARGLAAGGQVGQDVWIMGGRTYWGIVPQVERYSLNTNQSVIDSNWSMPLAVSNAGAIAIGTKIYVVGGATEDASANAIPVANLQIFDTVNQVWESGPPLPKAIMQCAVTGIGNKLYAFGGMTKTTSYNVVKDAYVYDTVAKTWDSIPSLPTAAAYAAAVPNGSGKIWVMGGFSSSTNTSQQRVVQEYDPVAGTWASQPHLVRLRGGSAGIGEGGKVYCLRGSQPYQSGTYDVYADGEWYDPARGYWMPSIIHYLGIYPPVLPIPTPTYYDRYGLYSPTPGKNLKNIFLLGGVIGTASNPYKYDYSNKVWAFPTPGGGGSKALPWLMLLLDD